MSSKKRRKLIILNTAIILINIALFSNALLGLSLFTGNAISISIAWMVVLGSVFAFIKGNSKLLEKKEIRVLLQNINSLDDCIPVLKEALNNGDVFDENVLKNIEQIKRFKRKHHTIEDLLLQKFSADEMSFKKFSSVLHDVKDVIYTNIRSILNKISAFDVEEYETMQNRVARGIEQVIPKERMDIYNQYIDFVNNATQANEDIILKLDKMLLEISRYNSLADGDVQKLPAIIEMDELIKNANLYR